MTILCRDVTDLMLTFSSESNAVPTARDHAMRHLGFCAKDRDTVEAISYARNGTPAKIDFHRANNREGGIGIAVQQIVIEDVAATRAEGIATEKSVGGAVAEGESSSAEQCGECSFEKLFRVHGRCSFAFAVRVSVWACLLCRRRKKRADNCQYGQPAQTRGRIRGDREDRDRDRDRDREERTAGECCGNSRLFSANSQQRQATSAMPLVRGGRECRHSMRRS